MAAPTQEEKKLIAQFRDRVQDLCLKDDSDMFLIRWIRGRDHNLNHAEDMLRKNVQWIKDNDFDSILSWEAPSVLTNDYPVDITGKDRDNSPVGILAFGKWDMKRIIDMGLRKEFIRYTDKLYVEVLAKMKGQVNREGIPVTQFVAIYDMEGLSMNILTSIAAMEMALETLRRFEANYPETLKRCYVVNASRIFSLVFAVVKPILSQRTFGKVEVFDSNATKWMPILAREIPREVLPVKLGGTNYASNINEPWDRISREDYTTVTVAAGGKHPVQLEVTDSNTVLSWSFLTANRDIGFSLMCDNEEVVKYGRLEAKQKPQEGSFICHRPGNYTILFDNSYSRMRAKEVTFKATVGSS